MQRIPVAVLLSRQFFLSLKIGRHVVLISSACLFEVFEFEAVCKNVISFICTSSNDIIADGNTRKRQTIAHGVYGAVTEGVYCLEACV